MTARKSAAAKATTAKKAPVKKAPAKKSAARKAPAVKKATASFPTLPRVKAGPSLITAVMTGMDGSQLARTGKRIDASHVQMKLPLIKALFASSDLKAQTLAKAQVLRIAESLIERQKMRLIADALSQRTSQEEIAASLGTSQASISRIAGIIRSDPAVLEETPSELIQRRAVGELDDDAMMAGLLRCRFTPGTHDPSGGDGYIRGSWREIENALVAGLLTDDEYERIARGAGSGSGSRAVG